MKQSCVGMLAFGVLLVAGTCGSLPSGLVGRAESAEAADGAVARQVLAFYYPWYGNPKGKGGQGRWFHWEQVDEPHQQIGSATHYPQLGPYDSHDPELIAQHCRWAKQAGITGFIASWWGHRSFSGRALPAILDGCQKAGLEVTVYYESVPGPHTAESAARDILKLLDQFGRHPAWLKVGERPVVFIYGRAVNQVGLENWSQVIEKLNNAYKPGVVLMGDRPSRSAARIFDGIHTYNTAGALRNRDLDALRTWCQQTYPNWIAAADAFGKISTVTVIPGYDDTKIRKPGLKVARRDGALYRLQWEAALAADPDWILITSWNEWHEGSEIEPSVEDKDRYLRLTTEYAKQFTGRSARQHRTLPPTPRQ